MPYDTPQRASVACALPQWRRDFAKALLAHSYEVHTAATAGDVIDLLQKHAYALLLFDESAGVSELPHVCDVVNALAPRPPRVFVTGVDSACLRKVRAWRPIDFSGTREELLAAAQRDGEALLSRGFSPPYWENWPFPPFRER